MSPSGQYLIVNSVSGGTVEFNDGTTKYTDRVYCSVVDMSNGCIFSDWDVEACRYTWMEGKDVLANSENAGTDVFDFNSMQSSINKIKISYHQWISDAQVICFVVIRPLN